MSKYEIVKTEINGSTRCWIRDLENDKVFNGYDFMGSAIWEDYGGDAYWAEEEEAEQIVKDLEAAGDPEEPEKKIVEKLFLLKTWQCGILEVSLKTAKQIAAIYELNQEAGFIDRMEVWDVKGEPKRISLLGLVEPLIAQKRWMEQEYRDYCDSERY